MGNVGFKHGDGSRGVNLNLVAWWEVNSDGSALVHFMGGSMVPLTKDQWGVVAPSLQLDSEPHSVAQANPATASPPAGNS